LTSIEFAPGGGRVVTSSEDGVVSIWDASTGLLLRRFAASIDGPAYAAAVAPDGQSIATGDGAGVVREWALPEDVAIVRDAPILAAVLSETAVIFGGEDGAAHIVSLADQSEIAATAARASAVTSLDISPDGALVLAGYRDRVAHIWTRQGDDLGALGGHGADVRSVAFAHRTARALTASGDGAVRVWSVAGRSLLGVLEHSANGATTAEFSGDDRVIATGGGDNFVRLWDASTFRPLRSLDGPSMPVTELRFSPDGHTIAAGSFDGSVHVWDAASGQRLLMLRGHEGTVNSVRYSHEGTEIVTAGADETVRVWDALTGRERFRLEPRLGPVRAAIPSTDGQDLLLVFRTRLLALRSIARMRADALYTFRGPALARRVCEDRLANGLSQLADSEWRMVRDLVPTASRDVCDAASLWEQVASLLGVARPTRQRP